LRFHVPSLVPFLLAALPLAAQLTPDQKAIDLQTIASLYAKQYAPYEWKRDRFAFDLLDLRPWIERARQTKTDLQYLQLVAEYTASLRDIHSYAMFNTDHVADLHLFTDIYDGRVLIELIDRSYLPAAAFDFDVGDEVVLFDGRPAMEVVDEIARLSSFSNPRATRRWAADQLVYRLQAFLPATAELPADATLLVRRQDGTEKSYRIPWDKTGTPLRTLGPLPDFRFARAYGRDEKPPAPPPGGAVADPAPAEPSYRQAWLSLQRHTGGRKVRNLRGFAARDPIYRLPAGFNRRLGGLRSDYFYSGTTEHDGKRIGFLRIGTFQPLSFSLLGLATRQFEQEIAYMNANTDVLVVDITRNEGGFACYAEDLLRRLIPKPFQTIGVEIRPNLDIIRSFSLAVTDAEQFGEEWETQIYRAILGDIETAYRENRGRTGPIPLCGVSLDVEPVRDLSGSPSGYRNPILLLTDEFSTSAADSFAAILQDAGAARLFGFRTAGAGGNTVLSRAGFFSEGDAAVTQMLTVRPEARVSPEFGVTRYLENAGVQPDTVYDYQTLPNLRENGAPFVAEFLRAAAALAPPRIEAK
jgi:hypothetical protein